MRCTLSFRALTSAAALASLALAATVWADVVHSAVPVSDSGTDNQIAYPNTGRKVACGPDGTIYVVYYSASNGIRVARSANRGESFHSSVQVFATGAESEIAVDTDGTVHVAFASGGSLYYSQSADGGATFGTPDVVDSVSGTVHMDVDAPWVYVVPQDGAKLYRNAESGSGAWTSTVVGASRMYADVHVDHASGDVIVGTDDPTVRFLVSTDHGATFGSEQTPGGSIYYSTTVLAVTDSHRYLYVAGNGSTCLRIDVDTGGATSLTFGATTISRGRTLAVDAFNNVVDGYVSGTEVKYAISADNGETFDAAVTIATADYLSVGINRYYGDIVAVYQTGGQIFCNVYGGEILQPPNVVTAAVTDIGNTSAACGGEVTSDGGSDVTARGVCWSTSANPTVADDHTSDGTGTGSFVSAITGLSAATTYHLRAYATNAVNTAYGADEEFTTLAAASAPTVTTAAVSDIATTTATCGGNATEDGGADVTARGVCWNTAGTPTTADDHTTDGSGTGTFASSLSGLTPGTPYHARAYATNAVATAYGAERTFDTLAQYTVTFVAGAGGSLSGTTSQSITAGDSTTAVTAVPDTGYRFVGWTGDGFNAQDNPLTVTNVTADMTVTAGFTLDADTDTCAVTFQAGVGGTLTGDATQTIPYGGDCSAVTAVPAAGNQFVRWTGPGFRSQDNPLTLTNVTSDLTVTAHFGALPPTGVPELRVTTETESDPDGAVSPNPGDEVLVVVTVENVGQADATDVEVAVPLPENLEFVSGRVLSDPAAQALQAEFSVQDDVVHIWIGDLAAGQQVRIELVLQAQAAGTVQLTAVASSAEIREPVESAPAEMTVADEYYTFVEEPRPGPCGLPGVFPLLTVLGLAGLKCWRRPRSR